jgi:tetratricopeptide (TPR) repeat protein
VEGSVRPVAGRLRVIAQLIEVGGETHVWTDAYEGAPGDLLTAQAAIVDAIARRLALEPPAPRVSPPARDAHVAYLKGRYFWNRRDEASLRKAVEHFREAITLDPGYAAAHAGMAAAHASLATSATALDAREARALAEAGARRALELDPRLADGHATLAAVRCRLDWAWTECERALRTALALDPNHATAHHLLGEYLVQRGRFAEADAELEKARTVDPLSPAIATHVGIARMYAGRHDDAVRAAEQALEIDPRFLLAHRIKGMALVHAGRTADGVGVLRQAHALDPESPRAASDLGYALGRAGRTGEARAVLADLVTLSRARPVSPYDFAIVHAGLDDRDAALQWLEKARAERAGGLRWLKVEPIFARLRGDRRFEELLRQVGMPA